MHPFLLDLYAKERHADVLRAAEQWRLARQRQEEVQRRQGAVRSAGPAKAVRRRSVRQRLGWLFVAIGLRLAVGVPRERPQL